MKTIKRLLGVAGVLALLAGVGLWERPVSYSIGAMYLGEFFSRVENHVAQVGGHRVHYLAEGPAGGPVVVLVHGLGGRGDDWLGLATYLTKAGYRVYMPDLIGYGRSDKPADFSYSVHEEAAVVVGFLDALGLKQVDLGGWSMGGAIVQHVAYRHPERVRRLILLDAAGLNEKPAWNTQLFVSTTPGELKQFYALLTPNPPKIPSFVARDILRFTGESAWIIQRALDSMRTGQDATDSFLPQFKMPVLIVWGAEDQIFPLSQGERMHRLAPNSELDVFPGCGHQAPVQCTAQIGPKVVEFVKR